MGGGRRSHGLHGAVGTQETTTASTTGGCRGDEGVQVERGWHVQDESERKGAFITTRGLNLCTVLFYLSVRIAGVVTPRSG